MSLENSKIATVATVKKPDFENFKKDNNKEFVWNYHFERMPNKFFTLWKERRNKVIIFHLDDYIENDLSIKVLFYPSDIENIDDARWEKKSKKDLKGELKWLSALLRIGRLEFGNKEVRKAFFEEINYLNK